MSDFPFVWFAVIAAIACAGLTAAYLLERASRNGREEERP